MKKRKLMVVDDDLELLDELESLFEEAGYRVLTVSDNDRVLTVARCEKPDCVLMDLKMYPKSGFQLACEMKADPVISGVPIVAMSAHYKDNIPELLKKTCGIYEQIEKPFNPLDVITFVERAMGTKKRGKNEE